MRRTFCLAGFSVAGVMLTSLATVSGQSPLPRPIVLYRPSAAAPVPTTVPGPPTRDMAPGSPAASGSPRPGQPASPAMTTVRPGVAVSPKTVTPPGSAATGWQSGSMTFPNSSPGMPDARGNARETQNPQARAAAESREQQSRPTIQAMQNPSPGLQLTHTGITEQQQFAPNNYFGAQFNNWTNQQAISQMPSAQGEMTRFQPGPFDGYTAPNTYLGSEFHSWSNLSTPMNVPGATGSWNMMPWW